MSTFEITKNHYSALLNHTVQFSVFLFLALPLAIPSGYSYGPAILLIASLFVCWRPAYLVSMSRESKIRKNYVDVTNPTYHHIKGVLLV